MYIDIDMCQELLTEFTIHLIYNMSQPMVFQETRSWHSKQIQIILLYKFI